MCPECFASVAILGTGIVSTGGVAAAAAKLFHFKKTLAKASDAQSPKLKENSK
jgi:hypothetical protein